MADTHPGDTERLHEYWVHGEGAAKIRWGEPGDFDRCVGHLGKYIADPEGYCDLAHHAALGIYPATHAHEIREAEGRRQMTVMARAELSTQDINDLPDSAFAYIEPGGSKDGEGKTTPRDLRHYPVHDEAHIRDALGRAQAQINGGDADAKRLANAAMPKIRAAARKAGIGEPAQNDGSVSRSELMRDYPLEDLHIVRSQDGGDGRTMEAFAAVFNTESEVMDHQGHYLEVIEPVAFNKRLADLKRSRQGVAQVKVMFNHGRDIEGKVEPRFAMPVAVPVSIEATPRGLLTRSRFVNSPLGDEVLELAKSGAVTAMSFEGAAVRSDPPLARYSRHRPDTAGRLTTVRRQELGLREFGPVIYPVYEGAEINSVRMFTPGTWAPDMEPDAALPPYGEAAPGEPPSEHSARYHQHALYALRSRELREAKGIRW